LGVLLGADHKNRPQSGGSNADIFRTSGVL